MLERYKIKSTELVPIHNTIRNIFLKNKFNIERLHVLTRYVI
jgi:hypothetical protein